MLRALAGYFFGGPQDVPQEHVECETKEVNDWLVVNMPDQPEDDIDLDEEADDGDEMQVEDLDEILNCLSNWFTIEELENEPPFSDNKRIVEQSYLPRIQLLFTPDKKSLRERFPMNLISHIDSDVPRPPLNWSWEIPLSPMESGNKQISDDLKSKRVMVESNSNVHNDFWNDQRLRNVLALDGKRAREMFQQRLKERNGKRVVKPSDVTCHPVYSKTYVNHRNPALSPPKTDLLQKIKDLEPEQRATQHAMKKNISRGQINRQNKNYIYETSTKKNRRKNLQRNPSGANNNRKCCY